MNMDTCFDSIGEFVEYFPALWVGACSFLDLYCKNIYFLGNTIGNF